MLIESDVACSRTKANDFVMNVLPCCCACRDCILQHAPAPSSAGCTAAAHSTKQQQQQPRWRRCVDLGCGTGLMGPLLRPHTGCLCGVDLSQGMVQKARERGCYDELDVGELVEYLSAATATAVAAAAAAATQQGECRYQSRDVNTSGTVPFAVLGSTTQCRGRWMAGWEWLS